MLSLLSRLLLLLLLLLSRIVGRLFCFCAFVPRARDAFDFACRQNGCSKSLSSPSLQGRFLFFAASRVATSREFVDMHFKLRASAIMFVPLRFGCTSSS